ncbi:MAG: hypothetical protein IJL18_06030, partial [Synergistaceae bacterium]|nr:hypothetical protein [Synergistaceae bacterium]
ARKNSLHCLEVKRKCLEHDGGILLVFAENDRVTDENDENNILSGYLFSEDSDLPMSILIGIALDRLLGKR